MYAYQHKFRPQFHYSPPEAWMNDPNGLVYYDGEYHLFYQYHPHGLVWGPMHWGHAVSPDLIHWETLPIALYPDEHGTIFSGSVVIDANNTAGFGKDAMVAVYSYNTQTQGVAYSTDRGRTWTKYAHNPVIGALAKDFRDPKVFWHAATQQWSMVLVAGLEAQFFTSPNLLDWTYRSSFAGGLVEGSGVWEVPDVFPLEIEGRTKWVLLISVTKMAPAGGSGIQYFVGEFDGQTFTNDYPSETLWMDYGPDNYAGTTWNNAPHDERLYIGWMNNWQYAANIPTSTWRGATTFPRSLSLVRTAAGLRLAQTPVAAIATLRQPSGVWEDRLIEDVRMPGINVRAMEIFIDFELGSAPHFGLDVHRGKGGMLRVGYHVEQAKLVISRTATTASDTTPEIADFSTTFSAPLKLLDNHLRLHLLVDESSVEVFADDGLVVMTSQTFVEPENQSVAFFAEGGSVTLKRFEIYPLESSWPQA